MKKKKKGFLKRARPGTEMELPITAMADVFTVILVFLLKSFASSSVNITPSKDMLLPSAHAEEAVIEALKVEISQTAVSVEGQPVTSLETFRTIASDKQQNGSIKSLSTALERERKRQLLIAQSNTDVKVDSKIMVIADKRVPYSTIKAVLASAAVNGYTDFKLAVQKGE